MWRGVERVCLEAGIRVVADGFGHGRECWRRLPPAHGAREGDADELGFAFELGQQQSEAETVVRIEGHLVEAVLEVMLASADRPIARVGMAYQVQYARQRASELHGLWGRVRDGGLIDGAPWPRPGVIAEQAGFAVPLGLDGCRR